MDIYIHKDAVGFSQHLVCQSDTRKILKVKELPDTPLVYGTQQFEEIAHLHGLTSPEFPPASHKKALQTALAGQEVSRVPWALTMPQSVFLGALRELGDYLIDNFSSLDLEYYLTHVKATSEVFDHLQPAKIDPVAWKVFGEDKHATQIIRSFEPDQLGFAQDVVYSRETKTGRTKVVSGPKILSLPKDKRSLLTSRFGKKGKIISLDYRSLEPWVALALGGDPSTTITIPPSSSLLGYPPLAPSPTVVEDLYAHISKKLGISEIPRNTVKEVVLSQLYGASRETVVSKLDSVRDADGLIELLDDFFGLQKMRQRLKEENEASGRTFLKSYFGRHVDTREAEDYMLLNYFIQSTAVDVALYGFKRVLEAIEGDTKIVPLFLVIDSIVLDVHEEAEGRLPELCKVGSQGIPLFPGFTFPLKAERF